MDILFSDKSYTVFAIIISLSFRIVYAVVIYCKINCDNKKVRNLMTFLSFPFPIITSMIYVVKYKKSVKDIIIVITTLAISLSSTILINTAYTYNQNEKYYDRNGTVYTNSYSVPFIDIKGNNYTFNIDKSGYERLYINNTEKYLNADLCYIDIKGFLHYDDDISITAKDETHCTDKDGSIYYPAKFATFNADGTIKYFYNSDNFKYDKFVNAYTSNYVPYYDADENKYYYSFNSDLQKGYYTNVFTNETFENEYSFVDENGYFVYDKEHNFTKYKTTNNSIVYKDSAGNIYYWASGVSWNSKGELLDSFGNVLN